MLNHNFVMTSLPRYKGSVAHLLLATLKQIFEKKQKNGNLAQTITNANTCQWKFTRFVDNPQVKRRRPNPSTPTPQEKT